jgi:hypothetical protein
LGRRCQALPEIPAQVAEVAAKIHAIGPDVGSIPGDSRLIAKPQVTAQGPTIPPQIDPIASDVPEVRTNIRAKERASSKAAAKSTTRKEWATAEAAVEATAEPHSAEASIAAKGRSIGCDQDSTQRGRGGERDNRFDNHGVPPFPALRRPIDRHLCDALHGGLNVPGAEHSARAVDE